ncbi:uncharacterized protein PG998_014926 [Apiospora kogelbergensis]|uniref:uncharacterized protein n=1 Tax=Apiospora kogelbergensis TaxID=1337665 RepID=UPI00312E1C4A
MVVIRTLPPPQGNIWYLAYGSNLSSSKFIKDRGIHPLDVVVVSVPGFTLALESMGFPYREPSFATIRARDLQATPKERELLGTAYLVTPYQYKKIISSEGGGIAYREDSMHTVPVQKLPDPDQKELSDISNDKILVRTLVTVVQRCPPPRPSQRYLTLIIDGAAEADYPHEYQEYLQGLPFYKPAKQLYRRIGAALFLSIWVPIMNLMEMITNFAISGSGDASGNAPPVVIFLVRTALSVMWLHHDYVHAPLWGRGDGLEESGSYL